MFFTGDTEVFGTVNPVFLAHDGVHLRGLGRFRNSQQAFP